MKILLKLKFLFGLFVILLLHNAFAFNPPDIVFDSGLPGSTPPGYNAVDVGVNKTNKNTDINGGGENTPPVNLSLPGTTPPVSALAPSNNSTPSNNSGSQNNSNTTIINKPLPGTTPPVSALAPFEKNDNSTISNRSLPGTTPPVSPFNSPPQ